MIRGFGKIGQSKNAFNFYKQLMQEQGEVIDNFIVLVKINGSMNLIGDYLIPLVLV